MLLIVQYNIPNVIINSTKPIATYNKKYNDKIKIKKSKDSKRDGRDE